MPRVTVGRKSAEIMGDVVMGVNGDLVVADKACVKAVQEVLKEMGNQFTITDDARGLVYNYDGDGNLHKCPTIVFKGSRPTVTLLV